MKVKSRKKGKRERLTTEDREEGKRTADNRKAEEGDWQDQVIVPGSLHCVPHKPRHSGRDDMFCWGGVRKAEWGRLEGELLGEGKALPLKGVSYRDAGE